MGLNKWADKLDFGPGTAKRAEKREQLKLDWAANKAKMAAKNKETKGALAGIKADFAAETAANNKETKEAFAGIKADWAAKTDPENAAEPQVKKDARAQERHEKAEEQKAKRAEKREQLKLDWAANKAKFKAETKGSMTELAARKAARIDTFEGVTLNTDSISYKKQGGSIAGATARVETAADARRRITATRLLAIGVFALAAKKQTGNVFLTVEHPDYGFVVEIPMKLEAKARTFAAKINTAAGHAARSVDAAPAAPDVADQLRKIGELHEAGILTDAEFSAKKTELLDRL